MEGFEKNTFGTAEDSVFENEGIVIEPATPPQEDGSDILEREQLDAKRIDELRDKILKAAGGEIVFEETITDEETLPDTVETDTVKQEFGAGGIEILSDDEETEEDLIA